MGTVDVLFNNEPIQLESAKVLKLNKALGPKRSQIIVTNAMEDVAMRMSHSEALFQQGDWEGLGKAVRTIGKISGQIGMRSLSAVCDAASIALQNGDAPAIAATYARLLRVGDQSLSELCEHRDFP
ncbi:hypothetical protein [Cognatishimia maritima]|uniref:Uncharacterized protein n=1 Tax=Cognatishimia maritima TaxID=870908 RepID=A0A1M5NHU1_9RHOB|nr:hypothetical protein [Cognatishimia maritima]SHG89090.1 hypothetical protein SAMN04488044_1546 [Cognatishimia maritima]